MDRNVDKLFEEALRLPEAERARLATLLIHSLGAETDGDAQSAWRVEIA